MNTEAGPCEYYRAEIDADALAELGVRSVDALGKNGQGFGQFDLGVRQTLEHFCARLIQEGGRLVGGVVRDEDHQSVCVQGGCVSTCWRFPKNQP